MPDLVFKSGIFDLHLIISKDDRSSIRKVEIPDRKI